MIKTFKILLVFVLLLFGCGGGGKLYDNEGYSFEVPDNWKQIVLQEGYVGFVDETGSKLLTIRSQSVGGNNFVTSVDNIKSALAAKLNNYKLLGEEPLNLDGKTAVKLITYYDGGPNEKFKHIVVVIDDNPKSRVIFLGFTTYLDSFDKNAIVLQNAISTFRFD